MQRTSYFDVGLALVLTNSALLHPLTLDSGLLHSATAAVILLEELERPLAYRDAAKEKLAACDRHFDILVKDLRGRCRRRGGSRGDSKGGRGMAT